MTRRHCHGSRYNRRRHSSPARLPGTMPVGFSLIEVLISIVVLSIGLLGLAAVQLRSSTSNLDASIHSEALHVAQSLVERMRANRQYLNRTALTTPPLDATDDNEYSTPGNYELSDVVSGCASATDSWNCYCKDWPSEVRQCRDDSSGNAVSCTAGQLAQFDAYETACAALAVDDSMQISVACRDSDGGVDGDDCSANSTHTIRVSWEPQNSQRRFLAHCSDSLDRACVQLEVILGGRG